MTRDEAVKFVRSEWDAQGHCASCSWHASLSEYGDLADAIYINHEKRRIELPCLSGDSTDHRGVRVYFTAPR